MPMEVKVVYACDTVGNHKAQFVKLIDTDERIFNTTEDALLFGTECTECLNLDEIIKEVGEDAVNLLLSSQGEDLLLNTNEFEHYRE